MIYDDIYFIPVDTFFAGGLSRCDGGTMLDLRVGSLENLFLLFVDQIETFCFFVRVGECDINKR
jgi:hypothetical protein